MPSGVDSPKYLAISIVQMRLAYRLMVEVGWILLPFHHVLNCLCILLNGAEEVFNARLSPVRAIVIGDFWLG